MSSIRATSVSFSLVSSLTSLSVGSVLQSSVVAPVVVSSTNESPGLVVSLDPSIDTRWIQSNYSPNAVIKSWLRSAHRMGEEQLPCPIPCNTLSSVLEYDLSETPNPAHTWCYSFSHSDNRSFTEFFEYPIRCNHASAMPLIIRA
jgi:hypothetical protein